MAFQLEEITSQPKNYVEEHCHATSLVTTKGYESRRWIDDSKRAILYFISHKSLGDGVASFDWVLFVRGQPVYFTTSGMVGPGVKVYDLNSVAVNIELGCSEKEILAFINEALNAYYTTYRDEFWEVKGTGPELKVGLRTTRTKWRFISPICNG
jgi:hypothetical protein